MPSPYGINRRKIINGKRFHDHKSIIFAVVLIASCRLNIEKCPIIIAPWRWSSTSHPPLRLDYRFEPIPMREKGDEAERKVSKSPVEINNRNAHILLHNGGNGVLQREIDCQCHTSSSFLRHVLQIATSWCFPVSVISPLWFCRNPLIRIWTMQTGIRQTHIIAEIIDCRGINGQGLGHWTVNGLGVGRAWPPNTFRMTRLTLYWIDLDESCVLKPEWSPYKFESLLPCYCELREKLKQI